MSKIVIASIVFLSLIVYIYTKDAPCASRHVPGQSKVCVCNETYCDTITREAPPRGRFVTYTTSKCGYRFKKAKGCLRNQQNNSCTRCVVLDLDPSTMYQTIEGFGGAVTDVVGIHWSNMSAALKKKFLDSYFSDEGLQYNMLRVPIGGTDFSIHPYAYNELPENDTNLTNFTLSLEDYELKMPLIKSAMQVANTPIHIVATTWSPPSWMKTNNNLTGYGFGELKPEYYQTYADYHYKFIENYAAENIPIWAITTTNEPTDSFEISFNTMLNCIGWTPHKMGKWIIENLGPTIRNSVFKDVKILAIDDQRSTIPSWFRWLYFDFPEALDFIDGLAIHAYYDRNVPTSVLTEAQRFIPNKFIISTEYSADWVPYYGKKIPIGSWDDAKFYFGDITTDLRYNLVGWIDWNLCLDDLGGPTWSGNNVNSPVIVDAEKGEFYKQPMFYAQGHFSKFIPRGSRRIRVTTSKGSTSCVGYVAFLTPHNTIVVVLHNDSNAPTPVVINLGAKQGEVKMVPNSITTVELAYDAGGDTTEPLVSVAIVPGDSGSLELLEVTV